MKNEEAKKALPARSLVCSAETKPVQVAYNLRSFVQYWGRPLLSEFLAHDAMINIFHFWVFSGWCRFACLSGTSVGSMLLVILLQQIVNNYVMEPTAVCRTRTTSSPHAQLCCPAVG